LSGADTIWPARAEAVPKQLRFALNALLMKLPIALLLSLPVLAQAQLLIGQTAAFNGPNSAYVREARTGATLYFDAVNEQGGVHGQKIELVSIDDGNDPQRAAQNVRALLGGWSTLALFLSHGSATSQAAAAALPAYRAPLVGPSSGAHGLRQPAHPYVFNVRASHRREVQQAVQSMQRLGLDRLALVQVGDAFGDDAAVGVVDAGLRPVLSERFDPARPAFDAIGGRIAKTQAQVVLFIADGAAVAAGVSALRAAGSRAQVITLSNNASPALSASSGLMRAA
jgi:ABC-type branched-subunit amino acid transport system substrate-binding protein